MNWWKDPAYRDRDAIICDGAVRSGKTLSMSLGFIFWASASFSGAAFALCGKTITSLRRNVVTPLLPMLKEYGFICIEKVSRNYFDVTFLGRTNRFYVFGGKDESSAALIQGMTLAGVFFDEAALMPRSFVEQAMARCSVSGAKMWFNCNPDNPSHWFYNEWIKKADEKNALVLHFTMDDNPSLSKAVKERYKRLYSGAFYDRFVLGKWTASEGVVYPMFSPEDHVYSGEKECSRFVISCDYGTVNPSSFGLWGLSGGVWHRIKEYYYSSKREGVSRTDEEHYAALEELAAGRDIDHIIVDPSAASFIECIRRHGRFRVVKADNDVISGKYSNNGLCICFAPVYDDLEDNLTRYVGFFTDKTNTFYEPVLESRNSDVIIDSRQNFRLGIENKLYFYKTRLHCLKQRAQISGKDR